MKQVWQAVLGFCFIVVCGGFAQAGTLAGTVRDGTTGSPASGVDIILLQLQGGMEALANTKSDPQGRFHFNSPAIGQQPLLLRAVYQGVNFHQPAPPGRPNVDIEVFEPTADQKALGFPTRMVALQPRDTTLLIGEEYTVQNDSRPPKAFYRQDGSFEFELPPSANLSQVSAWGPAGMPVVQATIQKGGNRYAIAFPFRPGQSGVRLSYELPYAGNQASLRVPTQYATARVILLAPPTVQVVGEAFAPAGSEQGWNLYTRNEVLAGAALKIAVSGTAPPPSVRDDQSSSGEAGGEAVAVFPARLDNVKWILVAGFASLFVLGLFFLLRQPVAALSAAAPAAELDSQIRHGVDEIKERLFRLELRRQAGTLPEEEYARERSRAEKALRDLLKG